MFLLLSSTKSTEKPGVVGVGVEVRQQTRVDGRILGLKDTRFAAKPVRRAGGRHLLAPSWTVFDSLFFGTHTC